MDGSTLFSNNGTGVADNASTDNVMPVSDDSAVINADALLGVSTDDNATTTDNDSAGVATDAIGQIDDPLVGADDVAEEDDILPNDTITTNDWSKVGEVKPPEEEVVPEPLILPTEEKPEETIEEPVPEIVPFASELRFAAPGVDDPEKIAFIKTYTQEFDDALKRATDAAQRILDAIDKAIHEHSPDITVPEEAEEFLSKKPSDNKVEKFEDAREIVREVLDRAADAKAESAKAAEEAARIYDEVQTFKKETKEKIVELTTESQQTPPAAPLAA